MGHKAGRAFNPIQPHHWAATAGVPVKFIAAATGRTTSTSSAKSETSVVTNKPTGTLDGHLMLAHIVGNQQTISTVPTGWVQAGSAIDVAGTPSMRDWLYYKIASSEGSSYTWGFDAALTALVEISTWSGVNTTTPIDVHTTSSGTASNTLTGANATSTVKGLPVWLVSATDNQVVDVTFTGTGTEIYDAGTHNGTPSDTKSLAAYYGTGNTAPGTITGDTVTVTPTTGTITGGASRTLNLANAVAASATVTSIDATSTSANLFPANVQSIETDISGWVAGNGNTTLTQSATQAHDGTKSASMVSGASGTVVMATASTTYPVVAGQTYVFTGWVYCPVASLIDFQVDWRDSGGSFLSSDSNQIQGNRPTSGVNTWQMATLTTVAPANAARLAGSVILVATAGSQAFYADDLEVVQVGGAWSATIAAALGGSTISADATALTATATIAAALAGSTKSADATASTTATIAAALGGSTKSADATALSATVAITAVATVVKSIAATLTVTATTAAALGASQHPSTITAQVTTTPSRLRLLGRPRAAIVTMTGSMKRSVGKIRTSTVTLTAARVRRVGVVRAKAVTLTASMSRVASRLRTFAATVTLMCARSRQVQAVKAKSVTLTAATVKQGLIIKAVAITLMAASVRRLSRVLTKAATISLTAMRAFRVARSLSKTVTLTGAMSKTFPRVRTFAASVVTAGSKVRQVGVVRKATVTLAAVRRRALSDTRAATVTLTGAASSARVALRTFATTVTLTAATSAKFIVGVVRATTVALTGAAPRFAAALVRSGVVTPVASAVKGNVPRLLAATVTVSAARSQALIWARTRAATVSTAGSRFLALGVGHATSVTVTATHGAQAVGKVIAGTVSTVRTRALRAVMARSTTVLATARKTLSAPRSHAATVALAGSVRRASAIRRTAQVILTAANQLFDTFQVTVTAMVTMLGSKARHLGAVRVAIVSLVRTRTQLPVVVRRATVHVAEDNDILIRLINDFTATVSLTATAVRAAIYRRAKSAVVSLSASTMHQGVQQVQVAATVAIMAARGAATYGKRLAKSVATSAATSRVAKLPKRAAVSVVAFLNLRSPATLLATVSTAGAKSRAIATSYVAQATMAGVAILTKVRLRTIAATVTLTADIDVRMAKVVRATVSMAGRASRTAVKPLAATVSVLRALRMRRPVDLATIVTTTGAKLRSIAASRAGSVTTTCSRAIRFAQGKTISTTVTTATAVTRFAFVQRELIVTTVRVKTLAASRAARSATVHVFGAKASALQHVASTVVSTATAVMRSAVLVARSVAVTTVGYAAQVKIRGKLFVASVSTHGSIERDSAITQAVRVTIMGARVLTGQVRRLAAAFAVEARAMLLPRTLTTTVTTALTTIPGKVFKPVLVAVVSVIGYGRAVLAIPVNALAQVAVQALFESRYLVTKLATVATSARRRVALTLTRAADIATVTTRGAVGRVLSLFVGHSTPGHLRGRRSDETGITDRKAGGGIVGRDPDRPGMTDHTEED